MGKLTQQEVDQGVEVKQLLDDLFISADDLGLGAVKGPTNQMEKRYAWNEHGARSL